METEDLFISELAIIHKDSSIFNNQVGSSSKVLGIITFNQLTIQVIKGNKRSYSLLGVNIYTFLRVQISML